jgi:hypothetical protein
MEPRSEIKYTYYLPELKVAELDRKNAEAVSLLLTYLLQSKRCAMMTEQEFLL